MSNSSLVSYTKISPNRSSRKGQRITGITPHHNAGNLSLETCGNIFANPKRKASSNYDIDSAGRVGLYVDESEMAWTSNSTANDRRSVTIEVANSSIGGDWPVSDAAWNTLVALCVDICRRNGIPKLVWTGGPDGNLTTHDMFANTSCPGPYLKKRMPELANEVNKRLGVADNGAPQQNPGVATDPARKSNDQIAQEVIAGKWGNGSDRMNRLQAAGYDPTAVQKMVNQKLGVKATSGGKSVEQLAREVWAGKWGSGQDRVNRLRAAGYDPTAVQKMVNKMYG